MLGRRPTTFGAPDAWAGSVDAFPFIQFVINNNSGLVVHEGAHAQYYDVVRMGGAREGAM